MVGRLVLRGFILGIVAGLLAFGWARFYGEPAVETAIGFEAAQDEAKEAAAKQAGQEPEPEEPEIFSRTVQSGIGLLTGLVAIGAGIGSLFAVLFALLNGRIGALRPGPTSVLLAALGLLSVYIIPALKYPANPPSVGEPDTIKYRTGLYFLLLAISIATLVGAAFAQKKLAVNHGSWSATVSAACAYLVVIGAVFLLLPNINEVPPTFPAVTLWDFRVASLGIQTILWGSIGVMFGYAAEAMAKPVPRR